MGYLQDESNMHALPSPLALIEWTQWWLLEFQSLWWQRIWQALSTEGAEAGTESVIQGQDGGEVEAEKEASDLGKESVKIQRVH